MTDPKSITEYIDRALSEIEYPDEPAALYAPVKYTLDAGGKRLRPTLLLSVAKALGLNPDKAINQAIGIEMYHNFTLLHDDIMDNADLRRGRPTVHRRFSTNAAILSGDAMLTMAGIYISRCDDHHLRPVLDLYNRTAMEVYEGQQYDMDFEDRDDVTPDEYLNMIRLKTSVLIGCACEIGAILADADKETCKAFYDFGLYLGLGFQLRDDVLDTYGDPILFGKQIGGDILNKKKTWLLTMAMSLDNTGDLNRVLSSTTVGDNEKISSVRAIYDRLGLKIKCEELIADYSSRALKALASVEMPSEDRQYFIRLIDKLTTRNS